MKTSSSRIEMLDRIKHYWMAYILVISIVQMHRASRTRYKVSVTCVVSVRKSVRRDTSSAWHRMTRRHIIMHIKVLIARFIIV